MHISPQILEFIRARTKRDSTPFYVYESEAIYRNCLEFTLLPYANKRMHFASMANIHPAFLAQVKRAGLGIFVNSPGHLQIALDNGFSGDDIVFTASALSDESMGLAAQHGVQVNLDSLNQLKRWQQLHPGKAAGIRCNIGDTVSPKDGGAGVFIGSGSRLGLTPDEIKLLAGNEAVRGLHLYPGTDITDIDYFIRCYTELSQFIPLFPNLTYINLGGGFGIAENGDSIFDISKYGMRLKSFMDDANHKAGKTLELILEPGRIIGGTAGFFVTLINDIKSRPNVQLAGLNASTVQFTRPLFYPETANHPVQVIRQGEIVTDPNNLPATLFGCSTYSRDIFAKHKQLPPLQCGDVVVFGNAGSYCASSYTRFLGFPPPNEYFI